MYFLMIVFIVCEEYNIKIMIRVYILYVFSILLVLSYILGN